MKKIFKNIIYPINSMRKNRELLVQLVKRNLAGRYKGTTLGIAWNFLQPLILLLVYTYAFGLLFHSQWIQTSAGNLADMKFSYAVVVFCGMTVFNMFSDVVAMAPNLFVSNPNYIKKIIFPLEILPIAQVITSIISNLIWFFILFIGAVLFSNSLSWTMLLLPVVLFPYVLMLTGISFVLASLGVFFRDLAQVCMLITQIMYLMTPIFYSAEMVPDNLKFVLVINPLAWFVNETRNIFIFKQLPDFGGIATWLAISLLIFYLGFCCLRKTERGFADVL